MKLNKLKNLIKQLDKFKYKCKEGCFECCTAISFLPEELRLMKKELLKNGYIEPPNGKGNNYCEYLTKEGRCSIYKARSIVCRSFSDIKFIFKNPIKKIATQSCTHGVQNKFVEANKDYYDYGEEVIKKGIVNKNCEYILKNLDKENILINKN